MDDVSDKSFIDRQAEQELFHQLLRFEDDRRLLLIQDAGGRGKSQLMRRLAYVCRYILQEEVPVTLVHLNEDPSATPISLAERMVKELTLRGAAFPRFDEINQARKKENHEAFGFSHGQPISIQGQANLESAEIQGGGVGAGVVVNSLTVNAPQFSGELEDLAIERCLEVFKEELCEVARARPAVLLLDSMERAGAGLRRWIEEDLVEAFVLRPDERPERLVMVLAGRESFLFGDAPKYQPFISSIRALSEWEQEHVRAFLEVNGMEDPAPFLVELVTARLARGETLVDARNFAEVFMSRGMGGMLEMMQGQRE